MSSTMEWKLVPHVQSPDMPRWVLARRYGIRDRLNREIGGYASIDWYEPYWHLAIISTRNGKPFGKYPPESFYEKLDEAMAEGERRLKQQEWRRRHPVRR